MNLNIIVLVHNTLLCIFLILISLLVKRVGVVIIVTYVSTTTALISLSDIKLFIYAILPHGVFEFVAIGLSAYVGWQVAKCEDFTCFKQTLRRYWKLIVVVFVLLAVAAYIETNITPRLIEQYILQE